MHIYIILYMKYVILYIVDSTDLHNVKIYSTFVLSKHSLVSIRTTWTITKQGFGSQLTIVYWHGHTKVVLLRFKSASNYENNNKKLSETIDSAEIHEIGISSSSPLSNRTMRLITKESSHVWVQIADSFHGRASISLCASIAA